MPCAFCAPLPEILTGLHDREICIALDVGLLNRMAGQARYAFVIAIQTSEVVHKDVLCPGKQRDGTVAATAIPRRFRAVLLSHNGLNALENRVHRRVSMSAGLPLIKNLRVTSRRTARGRPREGPCVERPASRGTG